MSTISPEHSSSVERHMLANQEVRERFIFVIYEFTRVFTQKIQGKTRVQNTRGTPEMELTESRV